MSFEEWKNYAGKISDPVENYKQQVTQYTYHSAIGSGSFARIMGESPKKDEVTTEEFLNKYIKEGKNLIGRRVRTNYDHSLIPGANWVEGTIVEVDDISNSIRIGALSSSNSLTFDPQVLWAVRPTNLPDVWIKFIDVKKIGLKKNKPMKVKEIMEYLEI